jgi:hypothetical protein
MNVQLRTEPAPLAAQCGDPTLWKNGDIPILNSGYPV